jgi:hypothetical protein
MSTLDPQGNPTAVGARIVGTGVGEARARTSWLRTRSMEPRW